MSVFELMSQGSHEEVVFCEEKKVGLRAIIAIHSTTLGPALGGCRMRPYESEQAALEDVLRLSRGMTYKASAAGLNLGGGKAVILADPKKRKSEALFRSFGRFVENFKGRYITAEDVGTTVSDMEYLLMETKHVTGVAADHGGSGDPSPVTAFGVFHGLLASVERAFKHKFDDEELDNVVRAVEIEAEGGDYAERVRRLKRPDFSGLRVAVQGLGKVGSFLVRFLVESGAKVIVTDTDKDRCQVIKDRYPCEVIDANDIYAVDCDIFCPCALGKVINDQTLKQLKCKIVCGAANNQLAEDRHGAELARRGILYAPDYVVNAAGLINVSVEMEGYARKRALRMAAGILKNTRRVFEIAENQKIPTYLAADRVAEERLEKIGSMKRGFFGGV